MLLKIGVANPQLRLDSKSFHQSHTIPKCGNKSGINVMIKGINYLPKSSGVPEKSLAG